MTLTQVVEALIFAAPKPISTRALLAALEAAAVDPAEPLARDYAKAKETDVGHALAALQTH